MSMKKCRPTRREAIVALEDLYSQLPAVECKGLCHDSCTTIEASELERQRIRERGGDIGIGHSHRRLLELIDEGKTPRCPALGPLNNCTVYDVRPFICRAFGVAPGMRCEHGCIPDELISDGAVRRAMVEIELLSERVTGVSRKPPPL